LAARKPPRPNSDGAPDGGAGSPPIFVCDASAEAERLMTTLRNRGHLTVDVPIGMLPSRVRYETPALVVCDADAHEALRRVLEMIETTNSKVKLLFVGHDDGALRHEPEFRRLATATLTRPLNLGATADLIESIVGRPPTRQPSKVSSNTRRKRAPILVASARKPYRSDVDSLPVSGGPSSSRFREAPDPQWAAPAPSSGSPIIGEPLTSSVPYVPDTNPGGSTSSIPPSSGDARLSPETRALLEEGRRRVASHPVQPARPTRLPTDGQERGVPQAALLEALQRPLDNDEPVSVGPASAESAHSSPSAAGKPESAEIDSSLPLPLEEQSTKGGPRREEPFPPRSDAAPQAVVEVHAETPSPHQGTPIDPHWGSNNEGESPVPAGSDRATVAPPRLRSEQPPDDQTNPGGRPPTNRPSPTSDLARDLSEPILALSDTPPLDDLSDLLPPDSPAPITRTPLGRPRPSESVGTKSPLFDPPDAGSKAPPISALGRAIRERRSCSLAQEHGGGLRRVLLKDGDVLTATSSRDDETLPHFLQARGDLPIDALSALGQPAHFGRHAGAALIARGLLRQEDLWPVLRGHAEWLLGRVLCAPAYVVLEPEIPVRSRDEPAVFGGAAGAEVFVEVLRRVIHPDVAFRALGSGTLKLGLGSNQGLLSECGLSPELAQRALAAIDEDLPLIRTRDPLLLPILLGLRELGIVSMGMPRLATDQHTEHVASRSVELDEDAFALRVAARRALVDEGDYFTVLGVARGATTHEVDRAKEALFREFEPSSLPARSDHLKGDIAAILELVAEAHEILRDEVRRERYRRALDEGPMQAATSSRR
jgi:hypothetical protein